jgi:esterase/lipase
MKSLIQQLTEQSESVSDQELKKLLLWASLHAQECLETIEQLRNEVKQYQCEIEVSHKKMSNLSKVLHDSLNLISLPVFEFETCAKDISSYTNVMAANGVAPYTKKAKGWQDKKQKAVVPELQFAML